MRWDENFASILQEKGFAIKCKVMKDDEDNWDTIVKAKRKEEDDCNYKPVKQFIVEEVEESLHELIRGNVLTVTRYYHQRVNSKELHQQGCYACEKLHL